ncbi:electron transfer flavoprotein subunit alpha/FixB family protein [Pontibaca salina]|uniref:Electron transfer flavoprotein subunit alpha/FixB family protein n=1 Tax=Pontibaca salina TaxID=2795731 RepID=A0A934HNQ4_9RHOB|nr:electron transfer flavoprotein subunit alpha/FixB family protein [Pontibaca salina]MBI6628747.1 electron transfer flavoprotein subunit alpha/FixB family protein [Pontibaca salina]
MANLIVIAEQRDGELRETSLETIAALTSIKQADDKLAVAIIAADPQAHVQALSVDGVDEVVAVKATDDFQPDLTEAVIVELAKERKPSVIAVAHGVDAWSFAPAAAVKLDSGLATDVMGLKVEDGELVATRAGYAEKVLVDIDFPEKETVLLTVRTNVFEPAAGSGSPEVTEMAPPEADVATTHEGWKPPADAGGIDIGGAEFILSIGRGVGDESNVEEFQELAENMGATLGCSRPIADNGWLPKAHQVGQSGQLAANCKLYIAMGVSGSVQHQWGMKHVENIVAVNTDPEASIFSIARYGIVGDMFEIAEELENHF